MRKLFLKMIDFLQQREKFTFVVSVLAFLIFLSLLGYSYAFFTISQEKNSTFHIVAGNFLYDLTGDKINDQNQVTIPANTTVSFELSIESKNAVSSEYILYYENELPSGVRVRYVTDSGVTSGVIGTSGNKENVMVVLENTTASSVTVTLGVKGGFTGKILALENGTSQVEEGYDFHKEYGYTGTAQTFTVPVSGYYHMEVWGAEGTTALGSYSSGYVYLERGKELYLYIGGQSNHSQGGWNGGGDAGIGEWPGTGGSGATDVRLISGNWNDTTSLRSRIIVAGGSGGRYSSSSDVTGGAGGLLIAENGYLNHASGGTQLSGGSFETGSSSGTTAGSFGVGGHGGSGGTGAAGYYGTGGGGGGGYYGGSGGGGNALGNTLYDGGGGGSSFISGYAGSNAITNSGIHKNDPLHYSNLYFINGKMETNSNKGSGKANINYIGLTYPRNNIKLDEVRYVKDCISSTSNIANSTPIWVELQVIKEGVNIAKGKSVTGTSPAASTRPYSNSVDGDISIDKLAGTSAAGIQCITIDLGSIYKVDEIAVWHYYKDNRTYSNHTMSISKDNSNWDSIINNAAQESRNGRHISAWD